MTNSWPGVCDSPVQLGIPVLPAGPILSGAISLWCRDCGTGMTTTTTTREPVSFRANGLAAIVDYAVSSHTRAVAVLVVAALLAFLPGFFQIPPMDRDEARFAQATKQMLETGEYVDIRFQNEVRYKKPVGIYWLQAAAVKVGETLGVPQARTTIWLYRLPSLAGA